MALFVVVTDKPDAELNQKIAELYPQDFYKLTDSQWLVSADTIARDLAEQLGLRGGAYGRALVIPATGSASGWYARSVWEWLNQKGSKG